MAPFLHTLNSTWKNINVSWRHFHLYIMGGNVICMGLYVAHMLRSCGIWYYRVFLLVYSVPGYYKLENFFQAPYTTIFGSLGDWLWKNVFFSFCKNDLVNNSLFGNNLAGTWFMRESRKFCQRGSDFDNAFLVDEGGGAGSKYHYKRVIIGLPAKRH